MGIEYWNAPNDGMVRLSEKEDSLLSSFCFRELDGMETHGVSGFLGFTGICKFRVLGLVGC